MYEHIKTNLDTLLVTFLKDVKEDGRARPRYGFIHQNVLTLYLKTTHGDGEDNDTVLGLRLEIECNKPAKLSSVEKSILIGALLEALESTEGEIYLFNVEYKELDNNKIIIEIYSTINIYA